MNSSTMSLNTFLNLYVLPCIRATRAGSSVVSIDVLEVFGERYAVLNFSSGGSKKVNITADSGIAIVSDICKGLM